MCQNNQAWGLLFSVVVQQCLPMNLCIWEFSPCPFLLDSSSVTSVSILETLNIKPKKVSRDCATLAISVNCATFFCVFCFLQFQRHLCHVVAAGDWWIILSFHLHSRSPGEAGRRASARPPFYGRHLSSPHAPLAGDRGWNMGYHKKLLAVRS